MIIPGMAARASLITLPQALRPPQTALRLCLALQKAWARQSDMLLTMHQQAIPCGHTRKPMCCSQSSSKPSPCGAQAAGLCGGVLVRNSWGTDTFLCCKQDMSRPVCKNETQSHNKYPKILDTQNHPLAKHLDCFRGSSVKTIAIQRRLAWPLRNDVTHQSRSGKPCLPMLTRCK